MEIRVPVKNLLFTGRLFTFKIVFKSQHFYGVASVMTDFIIQSINQYGIITID